MAGRLVCRSTPKALRACLKMRRSSVWERRVRLARREEEADPQRSVTDKQRRQRALPSQTLRAAGLSGLDCVGSGGTDRRRSAPPLTALPNPEFPSRRTPPHFQTGSEQPPPLAHRTKAPPPSEESLRTQVRPAKRSPTTPPYHPSGKPLQKTHLKALLNQLPCITQYHP